MTELGEIPEEWEVVELSNVINNFLVPMRDKPKVFDGDIPWCRIEDIEGKYLNDSKSAQRITIETLAEMNLKLIPKGSVICSCSARLGVCAITTKELTTNQTFIALVPGENVNNEFLYYLMTKQASRLQSLSSGTTIAYLSRKQFEQFKVVMPTLKEQLKIADILSTVDETIEKTDQLLEKTKELKKGLMQQLLTKGIGHTTFKQTELGEIPEGWEVFVLSDLVHKIVGGGTPSRKKIEYYSGDIPWFTVKDMDGSFYKDISQEYINEVAIQKSSANLIDPKKVIIATRIALGRGFINTVSISINQDLKAVYLNEEKVLADYFLYWYLSQAEKIEGLGSGSTVKGIRLEQLKGLNVPVPSLLEQQKIARFLSSVDEQISIYKNEKERLKELKKGLIQKLLTGKIRIKV
ncbi:restriction endonuclease subunit S [Rossellomorea marisflavi]|nr:restriction endonuclease subunit S [Rossellomorea marisflavi]